MKIVLIGNFLGGNAGDNLILESVLSDIRRADKDCFVIVPGRYFQNISTETECIKFVSTSPRKFALRFLSIDLIRELIDADYILLTAGTVFARRFLNVWYNYLITLIPAYYLARVKNKKLEIGLYNVGISLDGNLITNYIVEKFISGSSIIATRHEEDYQLINSFKCRKILSCDNVFGYLSPNRKCQNQKVLGLNIASYTVKGNSNYKDRLLDFLKKIIDAYSQYKIIFYETTGSDTDYTKEVLSIIGLKNRYEVIDLSKLSTQEICDCLDMASIIIGMRMHSLILSIIRGIPCIGIEYDDKVRRLFKDLQFENMTFKISNNLPENVIDKVKLIEDNYTYYCETVYNAALRTHKTVYENNLEFWDFIYSNEE